MTSEAQNSVICRFKEWKENPCDWQATEEWLGRLVRIRSQRGYVMQRN